MFDPHQAPLDSHAGAGDAQTSTRALHLPAEGDAVREMLETRGVDVEALLRSRFIDPVELDTAHPLQDYYISSSHNTYLPQGQLYGSSSAEEYVSVISRNARCVEVDAWPDKDQGPPHVKVTHGFTLTSRLPLPTVLSAISRGLQQGTSRLPLVVSLENHTDDDGFQEGLVRNFTELMTPRLVQGEIEGVGKRPTLGDFEGRVILMVEYYPPSTASVAFSADPKQIVPEDDDSSSDSSDDDQAVQLRQEKKAAKGKSKISPALAHLGFYAASIKPGKGHGWIGQARQEVPPNPLINISESALLGLLDPKTDKKGEIRVGVIRRTKEGLMRVYPHGLRVFSKNPDPRPFWAVGAQVVALNFQTFDANLQLNEALFSGTGGWVLKPPHLLSTAPSPPKSLCRIKISVTLGGISGLAGLFDPDEKTRKPYCKMYLHHSGGILKSRSSSLSSLTTASDSCTWDETLADNLVIEDDGLVFIRLVFKNNEKMATDAHLGVFTAYLPHVRTRGDWGLVRLLAPTGKETDAVLALKIDVSPAT